MARSTSPFSVVGVLHLPPLPGSPRGESSVAAVLDRALEDAEALAEGGADGCIVENFGDAPFAEKVEPHVTALLAVVAREVRRRFPELQVGLNALRNDGMAAMGAALAAEASFIRVNVLSGAMVTDQGLIQSEARALLLYRRRLAVPLRIFADVLVKHASPLAPIGLVQAARDTWERAGADALVITGDGTGRPTALADLEAVREAAPEAPLWVGSGVTLEQASAVSRLADGAIVGTALHRHGRIGEPLEQARVRAMCEALKG